MTTDIGRIKGEREREREREVAAQHCGLPQQQGRDQRSPNMAQEDGHQTRNFELD